MLNVVNSVIRQQGCLRLLHKGIHSFLESPGDWSYVVVNDPARPDYSDVRRWKWLGVVPSINLTACIKLYHDQSTSKNIIALLYTVSTAAQETKVSIVGFVGTCHISEVALEPTAAEKIPHLWSCSWGVIANCVMIVIFHYVNCNMYTMRQWNKSSRVGCSEYTAKLRNSYFSDWPEWVDE